MSSLSPLKRSPPLIHRLPTVQRLQIRLFSSPPPSPQLLNSNFDVNFGENESPSGSSPFLRWVSGIVTGSSLGLALYWYFPDSKKSIMNLADWSTPNSTQATIVDDQSSNPKFLFGDAYRRKIFFNYEKRIRMRSPPEKVFEYFASFQSPEGEILMTPADLMRAIVPVFPPSESHLVRDGYLRGERSPGELRCDNSEFFMLFDLNNDGLISFKEYIFFVTLLSIPESSFSVAFKMFDIDGSGEIDKAEFKKVMAMMRTHNRQGAHHTNGLRAGLKVGGSVENGGLVEFFFGEDGKKCLQLNKFIQFLGDLHNEGIINLSIQQI